MEQSTDPPVEIRSSARRRKTGVAYWEGEHIVVVVPERMRRADREAFALRLAAQLLRRDTRRHRSDEALERRAAVLADRYFDGVRPASIRWSARQQQRWGSCSLHSREIRISSRLKSAPEWVLDSVVVHELSHLLEAGHTARFWSLAGRYPRHDEAETYLAGFSAGLAAQGLESPPSSQLCEEKGSETDAARGQGSGAEPESLAC